MVDTLPLHLADYFHDISELHLLFKA